MRTKNNVYDNDSLESLDRSILERDSRMLLGNRRTTKWMVEKSCYNLFDVTPQFEFINYSCRQKPIDDDHLGLVDESWYLVKYQIQHHQVFIRDEACFSSESKHLHFNETFYW